MIKLAMAAQSKAKNAALLIDTIHNEIRNFYSRGPTTPKKAQ
jgi:hypothetical protein